MKKKRPFFIAAVSCMDGRIQLPIINYLQKKYKAKYVDIITEPGPIKYLDGEVNHAVIETIKKRVKISVEVHGTEVIAVSGHHDCAGNPVDKAKQLKQLKGAVKTLKAWKTGAKIIKLWVNEKWEVEVLK